jgi:heptosyltransferase II
MNWEYWLEHAIEKSLRLYHLAQRRPEPPTAAAVRRILICAYHGLGNFILYTPTLVALKQHFPQAEFDLQVGNRTGCEQVLAGTNFFNRVYDISNRASWGDWLRHIWQIRQQRYDIIINEFHSNSYFLALMTTLSGARYCVGHVRSPGWPDRYGFVYNVPVQMSDPQHERERYFTLATALGVPANQPLTAPFIYVSPRDEQFAQDFLSQASVTPADLVLGIQMGTSPTMRWKQWAPDRFRELLHQLTHRYPQAVLLLLGAPNERAMIVQACEQLSGRIIIAAGETSINQVAALIARCRLLVCNDSGLMHVAVAVQTPTVAIYGPTDYQRTAPLGSIHTIVRRDLPCSPCFKLLGDGQVQACTHHDCLQLITVTDVLHTIDQQLASMLATNRDN